MRKVDKEYKAEEDEDSGTDKRDVVAPEHEKAVGDEERDDDEDKPEEDFGSPPTVQCNNEMLPREG